MAPILSYSCLIFPYLIHCCIKEQVSGSVHFIPRVWCIPCYLKLSMGSLGEQFSGQSTSHGPGIQNPQNPHKCGADMVAPHIIAHAYTHIHAHALHTGTPVHVNMGTCKYTHHTQIHTKRKKRRKIIPYEKHLFRLLAIFILRESLSWVFLL